MCDIDSQVINDVDGYVYIENGEIKVVDPKLSGIKPVIKINREIKLFVNGKNIASDVEVSSTDKITYEIENSEPYRNLELKLKSNLMKAFLIIKYKNGYTFKLEDISKDKKTSTLSLKVKVDKEIPPREFSSEELVKFLKSKGIVQGINYKNLTNITDITEPILAAEGRDPVNDTDEEIISYIKKKTNLFSETAKTVNYKEIGYVVPVLEGDLICEIKPIVEGSDGVNIIGKPIKRKIGTRVKIEAGDNINKVGNKFYASSEGKPSISQTKVEVFFIHTVEGSVDNTTGNITFVGDITVEGDVKDGMIVNAGNDVAVKGFVLKSKINADGNVFIGNNVIHSEINAGANNLDKQQSLVLLRNIKTTIDKIYLSVKQLIDMKLVDINKFNVGQCIFTLIETKHKELKKDVTKIIDKQNLVHDQLYVEFKKKILGVAPLNIKSYTELSNIINLLEKEIEIVGSSLKAKKELHINYCQASTLRCTGSIFIEGKGQFVSTIIAEDKIEFLEKRSISRGGTIAARNEVRCGIVGSEAGVATRIEVGKDGHIYVSQAFMNTRFIVGNIEYILDKPSRDIHVYLGDDGDIVVEKLMM